MDPERSPTPCLGSGFNSEAPSRFSALSTDRTPLTPEARNLRISRTLLCLSGALSAAFLGSLTAFVILDYFVLRRHIPSAQVTALGAAILDPAALISLAVLLVFSLCSPGQGWLRRVVLPLLGALVAVAAASLSLSVLIVKKVNLGQPSSQSITFRTATVVWSLSTVSQVVFYTVVLLGRPAPDGRQGRLSFQEEKTRIAPQRPPTPPTSLRIVAPPYALPQASTPFPEPRPEVRQSSWRASIPSLHQAVRPMNSRTRLLSQRNSLSHDSVSMLSDSRSLSTSNTQSDGFETWDTSAVDSQIRDTVALALRNRPLGTSLEPIPGSRPVSPARALDGPFTYVEPEKADSQEDVDCPPTALSTSPNIERPPTVYSNSSKRSVHQQCPSPSPTSPSLPEAHIHPLFRTDSPVPPPSTTPGTIITASPYSSQTINALPRPSSRTRVGSLPTSPTLTRNSSVDEISAMSRSRSSSTTRARAETPPIPEFILNMSRERIG